MSQCANQNDRVMFPEKPVGLIQYTGDVRYSEALNEELRKQLYEERAIKRANGKRPRATGVSFRKRLKNHFSGKERIEP